MKINVGSKNNVKVNAVKHVFSESKVLGVESPSSVSKQPKTDEETRLGAINRALHCKYDSECDLSVGLEGGIMMLSDELYLCNWGALIYEDTVITASGARILLPNSFKEPLNAGIELSALVDAYSLRKNTRTNEGAIGIFTEGSLLRTEMFEQVVTLLKGQYYHKKL